MQLSQKHKDLPAFCESIYIFQFSEEKAQGRGDDPGTRGY